MAAQAPRLDGPPLSVCTTRFDKPITVQSTSTGSPDSGPSLPADAQAQLRADAAVLADRHGHRIVQRAERHVCDVPVEQCAQEERRVSRCTAAGIVCGVCNRDRRSSVCDCEVERCVDGLIVGAYDIAHFEELIAQRTRQFARLSGVVVRYHHHVRADARHVAIGKAVRKPHVQYAGLAFERIHAIDEPRHRFARGVIHADHLARGGRHRRADFSVGSVGYDFEQIEQTLVRIGVRVVLVADQHVGRFEHRLRDVTVKVELGADRDIRANARANAREDVAFAVVITLRDHCAVQKQHDGVERHRCLEIIEQFVA